MILKGSEAACDSSGKEECLVAMKSTSIFSFAFFVSELQLLEVS